VLDLNMPGMAGDELELFANGALLRIVAVVGDDPSASGTLLCWRNGAFGSSVLDGARRRVERARTGYRNRQG